MQHRSRTGRTDEGNYAKNSLSMVAKSSRSVTSPSGGQTYQMESPSVGCGAHGRVTAADVPNRDWDVPMLAWYLEANGCSAETVELVVLHGMTGADWVDTLALSGFERATTLLLDELLVGPQLKARP